VVLDRRAPVIRVGSLVQLCFECDRWQLSPSPCLHCGSVCESYELPEPEKRPRTLLEVLSHNGMLDEEAEP
jgi:hypothetical protein